uniref:hypothetical protein n=1 Tax=Marinococcus halophilus TaxID=1371 RepID=UPI0015E872D0
CEAVGSAEPCSAWPKKDRPFLKKGAAKNFLSTSGGSVEDEAKREKVFFLFAVAKSLETILRSQLLNAPSANAEVRLSLTPT